MNNKSNATRTSNRPANRFAFFRGFLRDPEIVGSVIPSSRFLEQRIMDAADLHSARLIVEFGPGTGGTTRTFLNHLRRDSKLLTIEISAVFVSLLNRIEDPRLINHCGNAAELKLILNHYRLPQPDVVISGVPFSTMPAATGKTILSSTWAILAPGGRFIAYQFRGRVAQLGQSIMGIPQVITEYRNAPPMRVFCWHKKINGHDV